MELRCKRCGLALGEMNKGKIRHGAVILCESCWSTLDVAARMAETAIKETPGFIKDLFGKFDKPDKY